MGMLFAYFFFAEHCESEAAERKAKKAHHRLSG